MTRERRFEILELSKVWSNEFPNMTITDTFFALYDDNDINGIELDYLMDWMTI